MKIQNAITVYNTKIQNEKEKKSRNVNIKQRNSLTGMLSLSNSRNEFKKFMSPSSFCDGPQ